MEPIQLLNNICEDARDNKKELWILLQDTAKAYDSISIKMIERAMKRIKIPEKMIYLILQPFKDRSISQPIIAKDEINQGETIFPLLWRIFYDPLLCKIQNNPNLGYKMKCKWNKDFGVSLNSKSTIQSTL